MAESNICKWSALDNCGDRFYLTGYRDDREMDLTVTDPQGESQASLSPSRARELANALLYMADYIDAQEDQ